MDTQTESQLERTVHGRIVADPDQLGPYSRDESPYPDIRTTPAAAVMPTSASEISQILALATERRIPVTPRGGGTGLCGGCVPVRGGIVLSLEGMAKILDIDTANLLAVVEPGVTLQQLNEAAAEYGLFFAPRPGDPSATFGGMIATNAGGSRALGYGVTQDSVRGLEFVLPDGKIVDFCRITMKSSSG